MLPGKGFNSIHGKGNWELSIVSHTCSTLDDICVLAPEYPTSVEIQE